MLAREVAFALLRLVERRTTTVGLPELRTELVGMFGQDMIAEIVCRHPTLAPLSPPTADSTTAESAQAYLTRVQLQGWGRDVDATRVFVYSKLWLRSRAPALSVDQIELEINSVLAMLLPTLFLAADVAVATTGNGRIMAIVAGGVMVGLVWVFVLRRATGLRRAERWEVVRNLVLADLMDANRQLGAAANPSLPQQRVSESEQAQVPVVQSDAEPA